MTEWTNVRVDRDLLDAFHGMAKRRIGREGISRAAAVRLALRACIATWEEDPAEAAPRPDLIGLGHADLRRYARLQGASVQIAKQLLEVVAASQETVEPFATQVAVTKKADEALGAEAASVTAAQPALESVTRLRFDCIEIAGKLMDAAIADADKEVARRLADSSLASGRPASESSSKLTGGAAMHRTFDQQVDHLVTAYVGGAGLGNQNEWKRSGTCRGCGDRASLADVSVRGDGSMYRCAWCAEDVFESRKG